jgi:class 3 adenylate cyclase
VVLPETRYARSGEFSVAYQVVGEGPFDLVWIPSFAHHVELSWENAPIAAFLQRLSSICRLLLFDKRGTGMSDRVVGVPTLETRMDDIRAVMDAAGSDRAVLAGLGDAGPLCVLFAATYPERTTALVLVNSTPRFTRAADFPWLQTRGEMEQRVDEFAHRWGEPAFMDEFVRSGNPDTSEEERAGLLRVGRLSLSPRAAADYLRMNLDVDVRDVLPSVHVPTLVMHRTELPILDIRGGRYLAERIPDARLIELPGRNLGPSFGDQELFFGELERFLDEALEARERYEQEPDRVLATVLFTDIVSATAQAVELGDSAWRELLLTHHAAVRKQLSRFRGKEIDTAGDGFFASFDGPARAIRCACAIRDSVGELGLELRAGLHTGECELVDGKVGGIAVHIGARIASLAAPSEVLASSTVKDLVAGSEIAFEDRGVTSLKGVPGEWRLFAIADAPDP